MGLGQVKKMKEEFKFKDYDKHYEILKDLDIFERIEKDVMMSKHFQVVVYNMMEMLKETGLFNAQASDVKKGGTKMYSFKKKHLLDIHQLFTNKDI